MAPLIDKAFSLPRPTPGKQPVALAKVGGDRYLLVSVSAVKDGDPASVDAATRATLRSQLGKARGAVDGRAFIKNLRKQYKITVAEDRL
jgi:peptidyl-prolyl cis-trans isomerase D